MTEAKVRIAHLAGSTATIQNTPPLVTSNKARAKSGLPLRPNQNGTPQKFDALRAQRLAAPAKIYVEQFSAHPLEADAGELYGAPDGFVGADGSFSPTRRTEADKPVYEIELRPEDGLYPLPYMALQADGSAWEEEAASPFAPEAKARQGFFPDGSRSFEEIDRLMVGMDGLANSISAMATVDFYRPAPPSGYTKGLPHALRTDIGEGDILPEVRGRNFFPYKPFHLAAEPPRPTLAKITNETQAIAASERYDGIVWTQGSPQVEETAYWLSLLIDTPLPICCNAAQRPQGQISNDGPANIVDSVRFIASRIWADAGGKNRTGAVVIQEQQFFAAREVAKVDARPGGYAATGGHGGILGQASHAGRMALTYIPAYKHTYLSDVNLTRLPPSVKAVRSGGGGIEIFDFAIKDGQGKLLGSAIPSVSIVKEGGYSAADYFEDREAEADLGFAIEHKLKLGVLAGFVAEGLVPYGNLPNQARQGLLIRAVYSGIPVVKVGRNAPEGFADPAPDIIAGSNLTATKARLLLMAALMKLGSYPPAKDPDHPTPDEQKATRAALQAYQAIFDSH